MPLDNTSEASYRLSMDVILVTKFERLRGQLTSNGRLDSSGLSLILTSDTTQYSQDTILFFPWHMVEYMVISTPEGSMSEDDVKQDDTSEIMTRSGAV